MKSNHSQSRRTFLKIAATAGAGFAIGIHLSACSDNKNQKSSRESITGFSPNIWIEILQDNRIICFFAEAEMGQAVATSLPLILAEELGADWNLVEVRHAPITPPYGYQVTGDSTSITENWQPLRKAGAMARQMLIDAAKQYFNEPSGSFITEDSWIINQKNGDKIEFGAVVTIAQKLSLPDDAVLRSPETFTLIGHSPEPKFSREKVTGELTYASDIKLPGLTYATIIHPPVFGSYYLSHNDQEAKKLDAFIEAFPIKEGVAVIATNTWSAFMAADLIKVSWSDSSHNQLSSEAIFSQMEEAGKLPGKTLNDVGRATPASEDPNITTIEEVYTTPFQAHATMEPMCCVAHVHDGICEVWAPTQSPTEAKSLVHAIHSGLLQRTFAKIRNALFTGNTPHPDVILHPQFLGGGFGRRLKNDYVSECVQIALKIKSPVKLQWTRKEDIQHDYYRATSRHQMRAGLNINTKQLTSWSHTIISPTVGKIDFPYNIPIISITGNTIHTPVPLGPWRSVSSSTNIYPVECFVDDIARKLGKDPVRLRLSMLEKEPRLKQVLIKAEKIAKENKKRNTSLGCAVFKKYGSYIALFSEANILNNKLSIVRMTAVIDCGIVVDPDQAQAQIEGGLIFALTAAIKSEITINHGAIEQSNFNDFPLLTLDETPVITIAFIPSTEQPGGLGELAVPPVAPSVRNALATNTMYKAEET